VSDGQGFLGSRFPQAEIASVQGRLDNIDRRIERDERRLELVEVS
jgi:tetrahydromethanopterin S-methyltransferase subunit G